MRPVILDLCGGTGSWSRFYRESGDYDVIVVDPSAANQPDATVIREDVRLFQPPKKVHGILAAPPCTHFAVSGARWWGDKGPSAVLDGLSVVDACLRVIAVSNPDWWALENPVGRLPNYIGRYAYTFQPYEFGDPWLKRTCIWGTAALPVKAPVKPPDTKGGRWKVSLTNHLSPKPTAEQISSLVKTGMIPPDWIHRLGPSPERATLRSMTPPGFARAFFEANP